MNRIIIHTYIHIYIKKMSHVTRGVCVYVYLLRWSRHTVVADLDSVP